jgi:hypothetical protein
MVNENASAKAESTTAEYDRLDEARTRGIAWSKWGPYLSERQWGTVREDYSADGDAWNYFTHDQARSREKLRSPSSGPHADTLLQGVCVLSAPSEIIS